MTASTPDVRPTWDGCDAERLGRLCEVPRVELFDEVTSTLDVAHLVAQEGAPSGTLVLADAQSSGRGRFARRWHSPRGQGIWMTMIERPADAAALEVLSLRTGLHAAEALDEFAGERVGVKWPNDLRTRSGKLAGILVEARWSGAAPTWVAIGIGVNVISPEVDDAAGLPPGTQRLAVLRALVRCARIAASHVGPLTEAELERLAHRDVLRGRRIMTPAVGTVTGIDASGALIVHTERGSELHRVGTVRVAEEDKARGGEGA